MEIRGIAIITSRTSFGVSAVAGRRKKVEMVVEVVEWGRQGRVRPPRASEGAQKLTRCLGDVEVPLSSSFRAGQAQPGTTIVEGGPRATTCSSFRGTFPKGVQEKALARDSAQGDAHAGIGDEGSK